MASTPNADTHPLDQCNYLWFERGQVALSRCVTSLFQRPPPPVQALPTLSYRRTLQARWCAFLPPCQVLQVGAASSLRQVGDRVSWCRSPKRTL